VAAAVVDGTQVVLVALVVAALEVSFPVSTLLAAALALLVKVMPAALDETLRVTHIETAVAVAALVVVVKMRPKTLAALVLAALAFPTQSVLALRRPMQAVAVAVQ
jgi:hypothetical protein